MHIETAVDAITQRCQAMRQAGSILGLVPTMGALHEGHLSLIRQARQRCDAVVVSIFVNPLQFGPAEDFSKYPRTWEADCALLKQEGVDVLFAPTAEQMYPTDATFTVDPGASGERLDGASRPGHFCGVATVVAKLFHLCVPHLAFFGQKDAAQVAVLRAMVTALNFPLQLVACPTVRDVDGLAMSSRNRYLSPAERQQALQLSRALQAAAQCIAQGERHADAIRQVLTSTLMQQPGLRIDYADVVSPSSLLPLGALAPETLLAVAAWIGDTRLIDNMLVSAAEGD